MANEKKKKVKRTGKKDEKLKIIGTLDQVLKVSVPKKNSK